MLMCPLFTQHQALMGLSMSSTRGPEGAWALLRCRTSNLQGSVQQRVVPRLTVWSTCEAICSAPCSFQQPQCCWWRCWCRLSELSQQTPRGAMLAAHHNPHNAPCRKPAAAYYGTLHHMRSSTGPYPPARQLFLLTHSLKCLFDV